MQCPRCQTPITGAPDATGALLCPGCGAKLLTKAAAAAARAAGIKPGESGKVEAHHPSATLPPGTMLKRIPRPEELAQFEAILAELRALRSVQDDILEILRERGESSASRPDDAQPRLGHDDLDDAPASASPAPLRTRRAKSVLLIDDDEKTRAAAVAELERASVPVRAFAEGQAGLQAIASERPDIIALELDLRGAMAGKDVINMIKATMEWVDIPIVLYTRAVVENQREARTVHGADEFVLKSAGAAALAARCVALFRKG